ncbi:DUF7555 family protein [Halococcus salsus]|uniref:DUF7555 family protein n=1 Tax=Halococcus salsus TaxID=2162894 RepID=UPI00135B0DDB|nr:hypothetical protein [Halococcus salsus]
MAHPDRRPPVGSAAHRARQALDAATYAVVVVLCVAAAAAVVSLPLGWGLVGVKYALFFAGFLVFGVSTLWLRPTPPWKDDEGSAGRREESRFQAAVQRAPPLRRYGLVPDDRLSPAAKLFLSSLLMLAVSFALETVFGVTV